MRLLTLIAALYFILSGHIHVITCIEPISGFSAAAAFVIASIMSNYEGLKGYFTETCTDKYVKANITGLIPILNSKLYGQHMVIKAVVSHIRGHIKSKEPAKALALSFHGWTGTGKNYVSQLIAEHLYKEGMNSRFVHLISAAKEFPHEGMVPFYKEQLRDWIEGNITNCQRSLFIFDEMDKMPHGLIDTIKPYLDYYTHLNGIDYRRAIFIFISNTGGSDITKYVYNHWHKGLPRDDIQLVDLEKVILKTSVNSDNSGLWHSELITKHMITAFVPFLPLTKAHLKECIKDSIVAKGYYSHRAEVPKANVDSVMNEIAFYPESEQLFSVPGCKRVSEKVDFVMEEY